MSLRGPCAVCAPVGFRPVLVAGTKYIECPLLAEAVEKL